MEPSKEAVEAVLDKYHGKGWRVSFTPYDAHWIAMADALKAAYAIDHPAAPAMAEALEKAEQALRPFADRIFNDNGDMTIEMGLPTSDQLIEAYYSARDVRAALKLAKGE